MNKADKEISITRIEAAEELLGDMQESFLKNRPLEIQDVDSTIVSWLIERAKKFEQMEQRLIDNNLLVNPCVVCGKEERNPGLSVCGPCYSKQIST